MAVDYGDYKHLSIEDLFIIQMSNWMPELGHGLGRGSSQYVRTNRHAIAERYQN